MRRLPVLHRRAGWRCAAGAPSWPLAAAITASVLVGSLLLEASAVPTTAQSTPPVAAGESAYFAATGYRVSQPPLLTYFQQRGGVRTFGYPISSDFPLLGKRVQIFQRQALEVRPDGSVGPLNLLDPDFLPITHFDGLNLPPPDPNLLGSAPSPLDPDYLGQALAFVDAVVPDQWTGRDVNFHATFLGSVTCADAFGSDEACDPSLLPGFALEVWGLPTSQPMADPSNPDFVYQRFQRGVMHYAASTGLTQGLLLGDWFKRVLLGSQISADAQAQLKGSPFLGQYAPNLPLGLSRPAVLADTSLANAFSADTLVAAQIATPTETLPPGVPGTATAVAATATALGATTVALQATSVGATQTVIALTSGPTATTAAVAPAATVAPAAPAATVTVAAALQGTPPTIVGCLGDEQMWFTPRKPYVGTHVDISVTSQRRHDTHVMRLTGPVDPGPVTERSSIFGWTWTWTIAPAIEGFFNWTFYADGLRPCITSGFPTLPQVGSTPTPTLTPVASATPTATGTATLTPTPGPPSVIAVSPSSGGCGTLIQITGNNFGTPPAGSVTPANSSVFFGGRAATVTSWTNGAISLFPPGGSPSGTFQIVVSTPSGSATTLSNGGPAQFTLTVTSTPTAGTPTAGGTAATC